LVLADAMVVIAAHEQDYWEPLCKAYQIALPATIIEQELLYFETTKGKKGLNPSRWIKEGKVVRLEAEVNDFSKVTKRLSSDSMASLDPGELEALAILASKEYKDYLFTTADRAAVKALGVLGWGDRGISVEELLIGMGSNKTKIAQHFTKKWFQNVLTQGFSEQHIWLRNH